MSVTDRGLAYGDGVFRTFIAREGVPESWRRHYAKLVCDCARLNLTPPPDSTLEHDITQVSGSTSECVVKVIVTRGEGGRGYRPTKGQPTRIVMTSALPHHPTAYREQGVRVRTCALRLARQPALAGVKHLNRLENVLARAEWDDPQLAEGILCDAADHAIGGTMTNLFIAHEGRLATPDVSQCGVAGVTRDRVIAEAQRDRLVCEVRAIPMEEVRRADELFLVNSVIGVWPIRWLDGKVFRPGVFAGKAQAWLDRTSADLA